MSWIVSLQKAIDYIEEHMLEEDLSIQKAAEQANSSAFHFQRTFSILTEMPVGEYIRGRRLTLAAQELIRTDCKIIDLAYKYGYDTPEAFTKAFRRQHGIIPTEARNFTGKLKSYNRLVIQVSLKGAEPMQYSIVEKGAFQVAGVKRAFSLCNEENLSGIPKMWDEVNRDGTSDRLFQLNNGEMKGVLGICVDNRNTKPDSMDYWVAASCKGEKLESLESMEIPASKWAVFEVHGAMPYAMQNTWKKIFSEWFPSSGFEHAGAPEMEVYPAGDASSPDYYSEVWIPVK
ncbi:AraC family transcriptional regulator [Bacillus sp. ISL-47]|uniref:AraC family transcriptional regulator n=1 Tax=Bacillus sp. ISL-47 TaxID=2819130 RepID=UPI001BEAE742|nr:AraC family transcriptional regulator [Bacillus sp. ISL-47]MBT2687633.1 AraC family transcriptional regulator [Bacillus sp. ISL-47]MBT2710716.1 AraC family transcriptional regulator [Pseudomonas sp. ISL-84]